MRKFIVVIAALAALAIVPSSAFAVSDWNGYGTYHTDNAADPGYWTGSFGNNGTGDSEYCADPTSGSPNCGTDGSDPNAKYSGVYTAGYLNNPDGTCAQGCGKGTRCQTTGPGGGFYVGTDPNGGAATDVGKCQ